LQQARDALHGGGDREQAFSALVDVLASHGESLAPEHASEMLSLSIDLLSSQNAPQRAAKPSAGATSVSRPVVQHKDSGDPAVGAPQLIVDDGAALAPGQIVKSQFLGQLKPALEKAAGEELGPLWSTDGCPYIALYLTVYAGRSARDVETFIRRYTGSAAKTAQDLQHDLLARVRTGVRQWKETGKLPPDVPADAATTPAGPVVQHKLAGQVPAAAPDSPEAIQTQLGGGAALDSGTQSRMGDAFGTSFADVRVHADAQGGALAQQQGALAFTVGNHVAFAPGRYSPGTPEGDALLAHELAHVQQQRGGSTAGHGTSLSAGAEHDADSAAAAAVQRIHTGKGDRAAPAMRSDIQLQRCSSEPAKQGLMATDIKGQFVGKSVGETKMLAQYVGSVSTHITALRTLGVYDTEQAAIATVKTNGGPGAVTVEANKFVAYETSGFIYRQVTNTVMTGDRRTTTTMYPPTIAPGVVVLISNERIECRPGKFDPTAKGDQATSASEHLNSTDDPFLGYREALGDDKGDLNGLSDDKLLAAFDASLKDTALVVLNRSSAEVKAKQERFARGGAGVSDTEFATMQTTAGELAEMDKKISAKQGEVTKLNMERAMSQPPAGGKPLPTVFDASLAAAQKELSDLTTQRRIILAKYPLLSRVEPEKFKTLPKDQAVQQLGGELPGIVKDIEETKQNVADGKINLWEVESVVDAAIAGFGLKDDKRKVIEKRRAELAKEKKVTQIVFTVFAIGFGIAAMIATGGAAAFFAAGAFGLGTYDAIQQTNQYMVDRPASNVSEDKDGGFAAPPGWGWLVVAWIGVGLDGMQVASTVGKVARGEKAIAEAAQELKGSAKALGMTEEELVAKLRQVAGDVDGATKFSQSQKAVVAGRFGIPVDIDPKLAGDIRVLYKVDEKTGRVVVLGLKAGPEATLAEVLAHEDVVQLMRRYEGFSGRVRQLWDKILVVAGKGENVCPYPQGSRAWEAWHEIKKLPDLVTARMLKYGSGVRAANESTLAADLEFLEDELKQNSKILDTMVAEDGVGFVAKTGDSTRAALKAGYPLPEGVKDAEDLLKKGYYYRTSVNGDGTFELARKAESNAPPLRVEFDSAGKPVGLVEGGEMTRAEAATALVKKFPKAKQEAFEALANAQEKLGNKVVPIDGMATTDQTIAKLTAKFGPSDFEQRLTDILEQAYLRKGASQVEAAEKAAAAAKKVMEHPIVVIKGTDQLRAFGYRAAYLRDLKAAGKAAEEIDDLHHMIPLYLGGDHKLLIDVAEDLHRDLHELIDGIKFDSAGTSLAPSSIQRAPLNFQQGAAILYPDGTVSYDTLAVTAPK
jgi:hypothetical protein